MARTREPMRLTLRQKVYERDGYICRKCGESQRLCLHHIIPVVKVQIDTEENLVTLCEWCHKEWEYTIYLRSGEAIRFWDWLAIPRVLTLISLFSCEKIWTEDVSARELRELLVRWQAAIIDCHVTWMREEMYDVEKEEYRKSHSIPSRAPSIKHTPIEIDHSPGLKKAHARGHKGGRKFSMTQEDIQQMQTLYNQGVPVDEICAHFKISQATLYRYLAKMREAKTAEEQETIMRKEVS